MNDHNTQEFTKECLICLQPACDVINDKLSLATLSCVHISQFLNARVHVYLFSINLIICIMLCLFQYSLHDDFNNLRRLYNYLALQIVNERTLSENIVCFSSSFLYECANISVQFVFYPEPEIPFVKWKYAISE